MGLLKANTRGLILLFGSILFYACHPPRIVTTWRIPDAVLHRYDKIMAVGIIDSKTDTLRLQLEDHFVKAIQNLNYNAVPAYAEFGLKGLGNLDEADTYVKLCNNGIDAVLTIALIDGTKEPYQKPGNMYEYPASHYYNRIWNYKRIQASLDEKNNTTQPVSRFWEIILYDLNTLEAACVIQTKSFTGIPDNKVPDDLARQVIRQLQKEKILTKKESQSGTRKAF